MKLRTDDGITFEIDADEDGYPVISIDFGGNFYNEKYRPSATIILDGVTVHDMFDHDGTDERWNK